MAHKHLDARLFDRLLSGDVDSITPEEARDLALHLLESCPDCAASADTDWALDPELSSPRPQDVVPRSREASTLSDPSDGLNAVFERVQGRIQQALPRIQRSSQVAPELVEEFLRQPPLRQQMLVQNDKRYQALPVAELLLEEAWRTGMERPGEAEAIVESVLRILDQVDTEGIPASVVNDVRARAWGLRGNFRRIGSDFRGAERAFARARSFLDSGSGDLLERARLMTLESTLLRMQKRRERASEMLDEAVKIYCALGDTHLVGRTMINQALLLNEQGESTRAITVLRKAQGMVDSAREPHLARVVQQNLVVYLSDMGRYEEAMALVPALRTKVIADGTRVELLRLRWQEGKIHLGLGNHPRSEAAFLEVRRGMLDLDFPQDVAVVSLELAALYMRQGRTGEIRELAAQMYPIFQSRDLHQEAIAALLLFQRAVEMDTLTLRMVEEVADVVRRSQEKPRPKAPEPS